MNQDDSYYLNRLNFSNGAKAVGWDNVKKAEERYSAVIRSLFNLIGLSPLTPEHVIVDFGCGTAILRDKLLLGNYIGVDKLPEYVEEASKKYPNDQFIVGSAKDVPECDYSISIGTFTLNHSMDDGTYLDYFNSEIRELWSKTRKGMVINGFHQGVDFIDEKLYYHSLYDLNRLANSLAADLYVDLSFNPYEFIATFKK